MAERLQNHCCWSSSREATFNECKKKYWYSYYGAWEGWPLNFKDARSEVDPLAAYLYRLKNIQPLVFFIGSTVHKCIEQTIKDFMVTKALPPLEQLLDEGRSLIKKGMDESKKQAWKKHPKRHVNLLEDYYKKPALSNEEILEKVVLCLSNWYHSSIVQSILPHKNTTFGDVEKPMQFSLAPNLDCLVVYDLYLFWKKGTDEEKLLIFDWKTGSEHGRIMKQLSAYALAAQALLNTPIDSIILSPFYLSQGPSAYKKIGNGYEERLTASDIEQTKKEISASLMAMKELHTAPKLPDPMQFAYTEERRQCAFCPFKELCEKAQYEEKSRSELEALSLSSKE